MLSNDEHRALGKEISGAASLVWGCTASFYRERKEVQGLRSPNATRQGEGKVTYERSEMLYPNVGGLRWVA